jgi:aminoglycoside phosphotransferase (APT) family kinase protein
VPVPRRDLARTREQLLGWLVGKLPDARAIELSELSGPAATGFSNDTLLFDLAYQQDGRRVSRALVCRIEPTGFGVFPRYDVAQQYRVMRALHGSRVPVPEMAWLEQDPCVLGAPFFVMERVAGRIPSDNPTYHTSGWVVESSPEERRALWESAVDALAEIHRRDPGALELASLEAPSPGADTASWQLAHWTRYYDWVAGGDRKPLLAAALRWLEERRPKSDARRLCWGDARIGNMIFEGGRCVAVLDWEMASLGPPEMDLGWFLYMDRHHHECVGAPRLEGFPTRVETVARWEQRAGLRARDLEYWEAFAAFRFAAIMERLAGQMRFLGLLPVDSTFAVDNTASRLLARVLELPPPYAP